MKPFLYLNILETFQPLDQLSLRWDEGVDLLPALLLLLLQQVEQLLHLPNLQQRVLEVEASARKMAQMVKKLHVMSIETKQQCKKMAVVAGVPNYVTSQLINLMFDPTMDQT